jgi:hypothetical protein
VKIIVLIITIIIAKKYEKKKLEKSSYSSLSLKLQSNLKRILDYIQRFWWESKMHWV